MVRSHVASSARCFFVVPINYPNISHHAPTENIWVGKVVVVMVMMVAHLRVIEDKVREDDQIEACCTRTRLGVHLGGSVRPWQQRIEERTDRISPHIPHHAAHSVRVRGREQLPDVQVLRDIIRQVIQERLVRVIREDHLSYSISKNSKKKNSIVGVGPA